VIRCRPQDLADGWEVALGEVVHVVGSPWRDDDKPHLWHAVVADSEGNLMQIGLDDRLGVRVVAN
jgi:hypothetical protein